MKFPTNRIHLALFLVAVALLDVACASTDTGFSATKAVLRGMVYNTDRLPVADVTVSLMQDGKPVQTALSDIHGRYALPDVVFRSVTLQFTKDGYEPVTWTFAFKVPTQIVYVQMSNLNELLDKAADGVQKRDWSLTAASLERVRKLDPQNRIASFLEAQVLTRQGKPEAAASTLEKLASEDEPSLAVELALADLYQGKLNQPDKALVHLRKAIALQDDADVRARIELLEKGQ